MPSLLRRIAYSHVDTHQPYSILWSSAHLLQNHTVASSNSATHLQAHGMLFCCEMALGFFNKKTYELICFSSL